MLGLFQSTRALWARATPLLQTRQASYLGHLGPSDGAVKSYKRLGRGPASGKGKTSGRGQKGQKARGKVPHWLEGGQTPYYKRFPIIGFKRPHKKEFKELTLTRIQEFWDAGRIPLQQGETLTIRAMRECGLLTGSVKDGVKLLGNGASGYNVPLHVEASKASESSIAAVQETGYTFTSVYHTKLGLQAHLYPERFLLKKGYVPLQARPMHKRDIEYYSNPEKGGYLLKDRSLLLDHIGGSTRKQKKTTQSAFDRQLETATAKTHTDFLECKTVDFASLKI